MRDRFGLNKRKLFDTRVVTQSTTFLEISIMEKKVISYTNLPTKGDTFKNWSQTRSIITILELRLILNLYSIPYTIQKSGKSQTPLSYSHGTLRQ